MKPTLFALLSTLALVGAGLALLPGALADRGDPEERAREMRERNAEYREKRLEKLEDWREKRLDDRERHKGWWQRCDARNDANRTACYENATARVDLRIAKLGERKSAIEERQAQLQANLTAGNLTQMEELRLERRIIQLSIMSLRIDAKIVELEMLNLRISEAAAAPAPSQADDDNDEDEQAEDGDEDDASAENETGE